MPNTPTIRPERRVRNVQIVFDAPEALVFSGDVSELNIICSNLLSNAVKYNREHGRVEVHASMSGDLLTLRVRDTGIGIETADQDRLFKAFSRIRNRETEGIEGSGLGLSILKRLIDLYDGTITVDSTKGVGSTFTATLKFALPRPSSPTDSVSN
jgi:signal transduction histidine kinase